MKTNYKFFCNSKSLPVDDFFHNVLYDKKNGYYNIKSPIGNKGDYITAPKISKLFSEIIAVWIISTWENFGKPSNFNIVELGPGDGSLTMVLIDVFKRFPKFNSCKNIYLFEVSSILKKIQQKNIKNTKVKWIQNFKKIKKAPTIFFGNEFFDSIPIKQFKRKNNTILEKYFVLKSNGQIIEDFQKASSKDIKVIRSFKTFKNQKFIEFPKNGFSILKEIIKKIKKLDGCLLMIDYGYLKPNNNNTIQSVLNHKKNNILENLGKADISCHVNFQLLTEFFSKNNLQVEKTISQKEFLNNMGIKERADLISRKMKFLDKTNLYLRLKRLTSSNLMGDLFKVILTYKYNRNYFGFK